jgi:hypothetical protein
MSDLTVNRQAGRRVEVRNGIPVPSRDRQLAEIRVYNVSP